MREPHSRILTPEELTDILDPIPDGLEMEIGCGNGHFLSAYARRNPTSFLVGVDQKMQRCLKVLRKVSAGGGTNIVVVCGLAEEVIEVLPMSAVEAFHIYFPDPWPKGRHRRRRFLRGPILQTLVDRLRPDGRIYFVTDFFDYSVQAKILMLLQDGLDVMDRPPPDEALISVFGQRFIEWGKDIHHVTAQKKP